MRTFSIDRELLDMIVKQLEAGRAAFCIAILATPTGDARNKLTDDNILRMELSNMLICLLERPAKSEKEDSRSINAHLKSRLKLMREDMRREHDDRLSKQT